MLDRKLKICLICDTRSIHYQRWIRDLKRQGHELYIFSPFRETIDQENVEFVPTPKAPFPLFKSVKTILKMLYRVKLAFDIRKKLKVIKPDLVHAHFLTDSGWIGAWVNYHPFVVTAHGSDVLIHPKESFWQRQGNRFVLKRANKVIMVANHLKKDLLKLGCKENKLEFIPNYADDRFLISESKLTSKYKNIEVTPNIVSARALEPVYSVETLIKAAQIVIGHYPDARIFIINSGSEYQKLKSLAQSLNIENNIEFVGKISHDELTKYFKLSHIYISTALSDGLSVTTLEGFASGLFPILTEIPANNAILNQGLNGAMFPCMDYIRLSEQIMNVINSRESLTKTCSKNIHLINNIFTRRAVLKLMENVYRDAIDSFVN